MISTQLEQPYWDSGTLVIGVDEAGRGALAGPVAAAAVIFDPKQIPLGLNDSKVLTSQRRLELSTIIKDAAIFWSVALVDHNRIDEVNILQATYDAMHEAINDCVRSAGIKGPLHCLIDGNRFRPHPISSTTIIKGDALSVSIAAASILAKTTRDEWMVKEALNHPAYRFAQHKGYGTQMHRSAIIANGPCAIHRRTFLKNILQQDAMVAP
ncbi:MAG: ribonuclease HII [Candidatus Kapabacteria bacterium]|nr:ribonuclease HII [Candidatus Kapabacteria bacterium]